MKRRPVLFGWWLASAVAWLMLGHLVADGFLHLSFEIPLWLANAITWLSHKIDPAYDPDAYDIEATTGFLLFIAGYLLAACLVTAVSVTAWRRFARRCGVY